MSASAPPSPTAGAALSVMNGNVGIGTWKPQGKLMLKGHYRLLLLPAMWASAPGCLGAQALN